MTKKWVRNQVQKISSIVIRLHFLVATECDLNIKNGAKIRPSQTARDIQRSLAFFGRISTICDTT